jgi:hypothetical protein
LQEVPATPEVIDLMEISSSSSELDDEEGLEDSDEGHGGYFVIDLTGSSPGTSPPASPPGSPRPSPQDPAPVEEQAQEGSRFRLNVKKLALTYPRCNVEPQQVLQNILNHFGEEGVKWAVVVQEPHEDGTPHVHVGLWLQGRAPDYRSATCLDFLTGTHGNYQAMKDPVAWVTYLMKGDGPKACHGIDPSVYLESRKRKKSISFLEVAQKLVEGLTVRQCVQEYPGFALQHLAKMAQFEAFLQTDDPRERVPWTDLPVLNLPTVYGRKIATWLNGNLGKSRSFRQKQLLIWGPTSVGKTSLILALEAYFRVYWIPMGEKYYDYYHDKDYDLIVFDEYHSQKTITWMNSFVAGAPMTLRRKGGQVQKRKNLPVIVLSNFDPSFEFYPNLRATNHQAVDAFISRFEVVQIPSDGNLYALVDFVKAYARPNADQ